jgi:hypothetical protein
LVVQAESEGEFRIALAAAIEAPRVKPLSDGVRSDSITRVGDLIDATARVPARSRNIGLFEVRHRTPTGR